MTERDVGLDHLLYLDGEVIIIHPGGYWVKFDVKAVTVTTERPHGLDYSLTLHGPNNERILGFDNAHPVPPAKWGEPRDHEHRPKKTIPYKYETAFGLLEAFWKAVDRELRERGIEP